MRPGERLAESGLISLQNATLAWLRQRGYPFADVGVEQFPDSTGLVADVRVKVTAGPRARYDPIDVEGAEGLAENVILRELPLRPGGRYDARELSEGQRELFGLGLFQLALVELVPDQPRDSTVAVRVRLRRGPSRVVSAFGGLLLGRRHHGPRARSRTATCSAARSSSRPASRRGPASRASAGASVSGGPIRDISATAAFRQPYFFGRRFSASVQPSYRFRDDEIETGTTAELARDACSTRGRACGRSRPASPAATWTSRAARACACSTRSGCSRQTALTARAPPCRASTSRGATSTTPLQPRSGLVVRPSLSGAFGDVDYGRGASRSRPSRRSASASGVAFRLSTGALIAPRGGTDLDTGRDYVLLRDRLFYAGGTTDVRGWGTNRLGPKAFVVTPDTAGFSRRASRGCAATATSTTSATGGRGKVSASAQLNLPFPLGPLWGSSVFVDAGRVFGPSTVPTTLLLRTTGNVADAQLADILDREGGLRVGRRRGPAVPHARRLRLVRRRRQAQPVVPRPPQRRQRLLRQRRRRRSARTRTGNRTLETAPAATSTPARTTRPSTRTPSPRTRSSARLQLHLSIGQTF